MISIPCEVGGSSHFINEETEVWRCSMLPGKVTQPTYSSLETDFHSFDLKIQMHLPPSFSFMPLKSPGMFLHHKTHLECCFIIKI